MSATSIHTLQRQLRKLGDDKIAAHAQGYFKTGPGEYGEGDQFIGIRMPVLRKLATEYRDLSETDTQTLLQSTIHEHRLLALLILVLQFDKGDDVTRRRVFDCYCRNMPFVNNWDLVDCSAHLIVGPYLADRSKRRLHQWAKSRNLWRRRIAIMSTFAYIRNGEYDETLSISELLLNDDQDLIHKAVGWMLREVGNRDRKREEAFLKKHYETMPRTMLRYAIEKLPESTRKAYLEGWR